MKKKVGIITIHKINNFGAVLQAYALNKYLRDNGYDVKTIDFCTYRVAESRRIYEKSLNIKAILRNAVAFIYSRKLNSRVSNFDNFIDKNIPLTDNTYYSNTELKAESDTFDYYICGSDQIWNTHCLNYSPAFVFDFVFDKSKCISYAASMGSETIAEKVKVDFDRNLPKYKSISVRESSIVDLISNISGKFVTHVCDPVFLLDSNEWLDIAADKFVSEPYIFFYAVRNGKTEGMRDYVKMISKKHNMPVVVVNRDIRELTYKNIKAYNAGPSEFLSYIKNADLIISNSFHAFSFSIILKKKFLIFGDTGEDSTVSRIYSQAKKLGLENRVVDEKSSQFAKPFDDIDFSYCDRVISDFIQSSKEFLLDSLKD